MIVRIATLLDKEWMLEELKAFSNSYQTKYELFPKSNDDADLFLTNLINNGVTLISETDEGERTGLIAGVLAPHYFNKELITLSELFWWVSEKHRGSRAGLMLYNAFMEKGKELSNWIVFSLKSGSPVNPEFFTKKEFKPLDQSFLLEVI